MKRAISLRAKADAKARRYTKLLSDAIGSAEDAAMQMNELNQIYGVDVSTYTLLTQALHANSGQEVLEDHLAQSTPGEEAVIFNQIPDGNGGQPLPANPLFGELVTGTPITPAAQMKQVRDKEVAPKTVIVADEAPAASEVFEA
ncbi:hypothetical protein [Hymenobacter terricola]|uniref:hypothetical protein n=1 Tax=Hymenobacter terricola TaxID=2819236 RepID=UPI001B31452E|nr:hypothetical protein [Hymenobacter terricola]